MGLVASQARLLMLTARASDLEFEMQSISQQIMLVSGSMGNLAMQSANVTMNAMNSNNSQQAAAMTKQLESKRYQLEQWEKVLDMKMKNADTQHSAVVTEMDSVKKIIDKNIERTFKYFA